MHAIVLLSGGLDSTVVLALAQEKGMECTALTFDYGQRHKVELLHAKKIADHYGVSQHVVSIDSKVFARSSLFGVGAIPTKRTAKQIVQGGIPSTYVPARNTIFIAYAIGLAEVLKADEIHLGANRSDCAGYPDCRPEYYAAFQMVVNLATQQAVEEQPPKLVTPLIHLDKRDIVAEAKRLDAPVELTFSCYSPSVKGAPCLQCDACTLRADAGI